MARLEYRSISKRTVDGLSVGDKDAVFWDRQLSGFGVRVYPSGAKVYVVQTRALGKSKRVTLGRHGVISADQARRKAAMIIARIKAGEDPSPTPSVSWPSLPLRIWRSAISRSMPRFIASPGRRRPIAAGGEIRAAGTG